MFAKSLVKSTGKWFLSTLLLSFTIIISACSWRVDSEPARLTIRSDVLGNSVTIDGSPVGTTGTKVHELVGGKHTIRVEKVGFEPFETEIVLAAGAKETLWARLERTASDYTNWRVLRKIKAHSGPICVQDCIAFAPDGRTLLTGSDDTLKLWEIASGKVVQTFKSRKNVGLVAFSPDGHTVLSGSSDMTNLELKDVASGKTILTFREDSGFVRSAAFSPDGRAVLLGSTDNTMRLRDVASGKIIRTFKGKLSYIESVLTFDGHFDNVNAVAFGPDGHTVLSGSSDDTLKLWEVASGQVIRTFRGHSHYVDSVAFAPDGRTVLSGSWDSTARLWDVASGKEIRAFRGHTNYVAAVAFSPDGRTVLSMSNDNTVRLWDVASGKEIRRLDRDSSYVSSIAFSPDGRRAASGYLDGVLILWGEE
uniref:WD40 repeat n=1 Tax=Candidatus Kentrum sp. DK TaxID=2126562 RepID=A0A450THH9_9GAMM|nr:MAG: WD40 repeat [Candidatus Kentron sp. DK]